jgi:HD-like signal output (HDOD) protein
MEALPAPKGDLFDHEAFWTDSLVRAMLARAFSKKRVKQQLEDAFSASLLADVALPVLLHAWQEYYEPIVQEWKESTRRLSEIEREHFSWDHAQAGAWIVQSWGFPEEMVCYIGAHNLSWEKIQEHELEETLVVPMAVATLSSSVLKPDLESAPHVFSAAVDKLKITGSDFLQCVADVEASLEEILALFGLPDRNAAKGLKDLEAAATSVNAEMTS